MLRQGGYAVVRGSVVLCVAILLGIMVAGCGVETTGGSASPTGQPTSGVLIGQQAHTLFTPTPTATPKPAIKEDAALLGGAVYAFDNKFGSNNCCVGHGWEYQGPYGLMWTGVSYAGYASGYDERAKNRVTTIDNQSTYFSPYETRVAWTMPQAEAICGAFMPPDAHYQATTPVADNAGTVIGSEKQYASPLLANTLPAGDFTAVNGQVVAPGTFYVYFATLIGDGALVSQCLLSTDETAARAL